MRCQPSRFAIDIQQARYDVKGLIGTPSREQMINGKRVAVVMPAYNAETTLEATVREIPDLVDIRILVDDYSKDKTVEVRPAAGADGVRARSQSWLWRKPADLLSRGPGRWR